METQKPYKEPPISPSLSLSLPSLSLTLQAVSHVSSGRGKCHGVEYAAAFYRLLNLMTTTTTTVEATPTPTPTAAATRLWQLSKRNVAHATWLQTQTRKGSLPALSYELAR